MQEQKSASRMKEPNGPPPSPSDGKTRKEPRRTMDEMKDGGLSEEKGKEACASAEEEEEEASDPPKPKRSQGVGETGRRLPWRRGQRADEPPPTAEATSPPRRRSESGEKRR